MGSGGTEWETNDTITKERLNQKNVFVGTGAQIAAVTNYAGQIAYCTSTGSGFTIDEYYERNAADTAWSLVRRFEGKPLSQANTPADDDIARYDSGNTRWEKGTLLKRKFIHSPVYYDDGNLATGFTFYFSPLGQHHGVSSGTSRTNAEQILSSDPFTVKRLRVHQVVGNIVTSFKMYRDATTEVTLNLTSANPADSGAITKSYDGTENMSFSFDFLTSSSPYSFFIWMEIEWDDLF